MADEKKTFENGVEKLWKQLDNMNKQQEREIITRVAEVRKEIVDKISGAPTYTSAQGIETIDPFFMQQYEGELRQLLIEWARKNIDALDKTLDKAAELGGTGYRELLSQLAGLELPTLRPSIIGADPKIVQAAALFNGQQFTELANKIQTQVAGSIQRSIFGAQSRWDATREIRDTLKGQPGQSTGLGGLTAAATRIERTATMSIFNAATRSAYSDAAKTLPGLMIEWSTAGQKSVCPKCQALNGKRIKPKDFFPGKLLSPPAHPSCRCRTIAYMPGWPD